MKKNKNKIFSILIFALILSSALFISCSDSDKEEFVAGDTTNLKKELKECYDSISVATPDKFTTETVNDFKSKVDIVNDIVEQGNVSQQEVINMSIHIREAFTRFLNSRMTGIPEENLLAGWSFDEGTGTSLVGDGVKALTATLKPGPSEIFSTSVLPEFVDDGVNKALYFKSGAHLEVENYNPSDFLGKKLSIAVWLKPEVIKGGNYVVSMNYWNNWKFQIQEQGKAFFTIKSQAGFTDADNEADLSVSTGSWKHVVVVLDLESSKLSFYINGLLTKEWTSTGKPNLVGSQSAPYVSPLGTQLPLMIGAATTYAEAKASWDWSGWDTPTSWDHFQGMMDEIKFYNTALLSGQVQWLYNQEVEKLKQ